MSANNTTNVEITLNRANAGLAAAIARVKGLTVEQLISSCLKGSTNLNT